MKGYLKIEATPEVKEGEDYTSLTTEICLEEISFIDKMQVMSCVAKALKLGSEELEIFMVTQKTGLWAKTRNTTEHVNKEATFIFEDMLKALFGANDDNKEE